MAATATAMAGLNRISPIRQFIMLVALAIAVALGVTVALWSQTPNYTLLYGSLSGNDASDVLEVLRREDIPYSVERDSGAILVASSKVHEARLKLAGDGLPHGSDMGFQMLEQERSFGTSQFIEQARYHRALEVELARSITSLDKVESTRVHLALPKQSAFLRNDRKPSASVLIELYSGRVLEPKEAAAIAHLVAAGIPNLEADGVQVIDEKGRLLTAPQEDSGIAASNKEYEYTQRFETEYRNRIERLLGAIVGANGVNAQVTAELDFTRTEQARESFTPNPEAVRSEKLLEENVGLNGFGGIPGALSNQPPLDAQVPEVAGGEGEQSEADSSQSRLRKQSTRNYELDRVVDHVITPGVSIRRFSVAVVIDDKTSLAEDGSVVREARGTEEMQRIESLVKEIIGFDEERGDRVNIVNTAFVVPEVEITEIPEIPLWKQPFVLDLAKQAGGGLLILIIVFGLLRPLMKNLVNRDLAEREMLVAQEQTAMLPPGEARGGGVEGGEGALGGQAMLAQQPEHNLETIRSLVDQDPKRVASVMKSWVDGNG